MRVKNLPTTLTCIFPLLIKLCCSGILDGFGMCAIRIILSRRKAGAALEPYDDPKQCGACSDNLNNIKQKNLKTCKQLRKNEQK